MHDRGSISLEYHLAMSPKLNFRRSTARHFHYEADAQEKCMHVFPRRAQGSPWQHHPMEPEWKQPKLLSEKRTDSREYSAAETRMSSLATTQTAQRTSRYAAGRERAHCKIPFTGSPKQANRPLRLKSASWSHFGEATGRGPQGASGAPAMFCFSFCT